MAALFVTTVSAPTPISEFPPTHQPSRGHFEQCCRGKGLAGLDATAPCDEDPLLSGTMIDGLAMKLEADSLFGVDRITTSNYITCAITGGATTPPSTVKACCAHMEE